MTGNVEANTEPLGMHIAAWCNTKFSLESGKPRREEHTALRCQLPCRLEDLYTHYLESYPLRRRNVKTWLLLAFGNFEDPRPSADVRYLAGDSG